MSDIISFRGDKEKWKIFVARLKKRGDTVWGMMEKCIKNDLLEHKLRIEVKDKPKCPLCNIIPKRHLVRHHTSYVPETFMDVCASCHVKIHNSESYFPELKPKQQRPSLTSFGDDISKINTWKNTLSDSGVSL